MRQLVYTMFISNNGASFHLWWKENLVKHWKVSKYYETDCSKTIYYWQKLFLLTLVSHSKVIKFISSKNFNRVKMRRFLKPWIKNIWSSFLINFLYINIAAFKIFNLHTLRILFDWNNCFVCYVCYKLSAFHGFVDYSHVHSILKLFYGWANFPFITSETKCDY